MGTHHGGDGEVPPDGDLPPEDRLDPADLPPGWDLTIPDDLSALAAEAAQVREELAREKLPPTRPLEGAGGTGPQLRPPLLIMSAAVMVTMLSLFVMAWSGAGAPTAPARDPSAALQSLALTDAAGRRVALAAHTPTVILLVEECDCAAMISATAAAAPPGVTVVAIGHAPPSRPASLGGTARTPLLLADPGGAVRARLDLEPPVNAATVVLVDQAGTIIRTHPAATSVAQFQADLTRLAPR